MQRRLQRLSVPQWLDALKGESYIDLDGKEVKPERFDIVFDNVRFGYDEREILKGVSFTIPSGTMTAIVGPSGSGKSTICNLMARFYDVDGEGFFLVDMICGNSPVTACFPIFLWYFRRSTCSMTL